MNSSLIMIHGTTWYDVVYYVVVPDYHMVVPDYHMVVLDYHMVYHTWSNTWVSIVVLAGSAEPDLLGPHLQGRSQGLQ